MIATRVRYQAYHQPGGQRPSPVFDTIEECQEWVLDKCIDGHNKDKPCEGAKEEWFIERVI